MIVLGLADTLKDFAAAALKDLRLKSYERPTGRDSGSLFPTDTAAQHEVIETESGIRIYVGVLPPKDAAGADHPYVVIRPVQATVDNGGTLATVLITVGVYAADNEAWRDAVEICQRLASALTALPNNILAGKYERETQLTWQEQSGRDDPFWEADMSTGWRLYTDQFQYEDML